LIRKFNKKYKKLMLFIENFREEELKGKKLSVKQL
jgi:hypothetical protein